MKIESIRIENFRCFKDETIQFNNYTCFVGSNGAGKSTVLAALNVFFRQYKDSSTDLCKLSLDDFHHKDVKEPIRITLTFFNLSQKAKNELSDYVRQDKLIVSATAKYEPSKAYAELIHNGSRMGFKDFVRYFEAEKAGTKVAELKTIYSSLKDSYSELPQAVTKEAMAVALREYEAKPLNLKECSEIPSPDEFYGINGAGKLAPYIQWVFVPASKDVTQEGEESKTSALGQLLERTVRSKINFTEKIENIKKVARGEYQKILDAEQSVLNELSESLDLRLKSWAHPGVSVQILWKQGTEKSVDIKNPVAYIKLGEKGFEGELARFGHGLQRSYMLTLLQELASIKDEQAPTLVMGIEEPELYQHPPQIRYLAELLHDLSKETTQIIVCTHSPLFIPGDDFETVRMVREKGSPACSYISSLTRSELAKRLNVCGQKIIAESGLAAKLFSLLKPAFNEMFFCRILIFVEGAEDVAYITSYLNLTGKMYDFRRYGCHIVPVGGKNNLPQSIGIANILEIPVFVVFDADTAEGCTDNVRLEKEDENKPILKLLGQHSNNNEWPDRDIYNNNLVMWKTDIAKTIEKDIDGWKDYKDQAAHKCGFRNSQKNHMVIVYALDKAWGDKKKSGSLLKLIDSIISFAESKRNFHHNEHIGAVDSGLGNTSAG